MSNYVRDKGAVRDRLYGMPRPDAPGEFADDIQELVEELLDEGYPRDELYDKLQHIALVLRRDGHEDLEDEVLEVMDVLSGWAPPSSRI